jgi:hypothetical protein
MSRALIHLKSPNPCSLNSFSSFSLSAIFGLLNHKIALIISSESKMNPMTKGKEEQYRYTVEDPPVPRK